MLALDTNTGEVKWSVLTAGTDVWTIACPKPDKNPQNCPEPEGPDYGKH